MPSEKVGNEKTPYPETKEMNDRDLLNDLLATEKGLSSAYTIALHEASNDTLFSSIKQLHDETLQSQRKLYNLMFEKGWYQLEKAEQEKLQQAHTQFSGFAVQFPY